MRPPCKQVAVVGGGLGGIGAIKALKEEGIEPVCFEKSDDIGGTWHYREEDTHGLPSVMWTTTINHSKEFGLSDFPFPKEAPNHMRHFEILKFFREFVEKFDLKKHISCNREVVLVKRANDYEESGKWVVTVKNTKDGSVSTEIFDAVFVCVGHICYPKMPTYPGMDEFLGKVMHTHSLKKLDKFSEQRVTVVGTGCSALDAAVEISTIAKQVYLSTRTPSWIIPRVGPHGMPIDFALARRYITYLQQMLPLNWMSWILQQYFLNPKFNHRLFGINPKYPVLSKDPTVNDAIPSKLLSGAVVLRKDIKNFTKDGVVFDGEHEVTKTDSVIMGTGYTWNFDFLEEGTVKIEDGRFRLYKCMYPTHLKHPTLVIIGFALPYGPGFPIGELQLRWAAHLLARNKSLPSEEMMLQEAKTRHDENCKRYSPSEKMSIRVDYVPYCDELATELGVMPNFWKMAVTDPKLFMACIFGACVPYQYRLVGPHKWKGAREAILTSSERMQAPLSNKRLNKKQKSRFTFKNMLISLCLMIVCLLCWKDSSLKYYFGALLLPYPFLSNNFFSKFFGFFLLLSYLFNTYGFTAMYIVTVIGFLYCNLGNILVNSYFWT